MSNPTGDNVFLHELEVSIREELTLAETSLPPEVQANCVPIEEWLLDPADAQPYEVRLRTLLGAAEALENGPGPSTDGEGP